jgi:DNA polymerase
MRSFNDLETYSETPINCGAHRYAEGAEVLLWSYALDDAPVQVWDATSGARMPSDLYDQLADERNEVWFHNGGMFDFVVLSHVGLSIGMPPVAMSRWRDTMVQAYMHSLPGALDKLGAVLGLAEEMQKLKTGKDLVRLFCQPRPAGQKLRRATRETHPAEWAEFVRYAGGDIVAMRECLAKMPKWNATEREWALWQLDLRVNYRGVAIDTQLVESAIRAADKAQDALADQVQQLTDGDVQRATQRDEMLRHLLLEHGVGLPDMKADTLERRMQDPELPPAVKDLLGVRLQASTTSVSKYKALAKSVSSDGRLRGTLQFRGAARTGRWSGRVFQPQNLPRPALKQADIDLGIEAVKLGCETLLYGNVMELLSSAIRGAIVAAPGKKLCIADLSNIEGRVCAWLAGESWKLQAFRDFDAGKGQDLYKVAYAKAFAIQAADVQKDQRQIGKVMELMLQYQGGVGAFITGAATYGIDLAKMAEAALPSVPADVLDEASRFWDWTKEQKRSTFGLAREVFIACDALKRLWRRAHPAIDSLWPELEDAVRAAINEPGAVFHIRRLKVRRVGSWLQLRLPSGRNLSYPMVRVEQDNSISYMGQDQYTRQWKRLKTYGGKLLENVTQAVACDQLADCMPLIEAAGYPIVLSVHDELLTETPDSPEFTADHLAELMTSDLGWNEGLPLAAAGYETYRYRKD